MSPPGPGAAREYHLFIYDTWMSDQPGSARLGAARPIGPAATEPKYDLVDLGTQIALVTGGATSVRGEVVAMDAQLLASLDVEKGHPLRYKRIRIRLDDGQEVEAYTLEADQTRGRRRIRSGDYRAHASPAGPERYSNAWSRWAKTRRS